MTGRGPNRAGMESRRRLVAAGLGHFLALGYEAAGVDAITRAAGIPKGSFYNHFGSKEAFGAAVVDSFFDGVIEKLRTAIEDPSRAPVERLRRYFDTRIMELTAEGHRGGCLLGNMSLEAADRSEVLRERVAAHLRTWSGIIAGCLREAQEQGDVDGRHRPEELADFVLNTWQGAVLRAKVSRSAGPLSLARAIIFEHLLPPRSERVPSVPAKPVRRPRPGQGSAQPRRRPRATPAG